MLSESDGQGKRQQHGAGKEEGIGAARTFRVPACQPVSGGQMSHSGDDPDSAEENACCRPWRTLRTGPGEKPRQR